ncbi:MAG: LD-carboxypeptidase [Deltaproteobacteria bacterium]|nr:LD-carboxypeptidase [Deltaproteobacteria bacterium]
MLKPEGIVKGDTFGIMAPAGSVTPDELEEGIELIRGSGYRVILARNIFHSKAYLAGDDTARLQDLHDMFLDRRVKAIMCARGGAGSMRLLDKIDYELIRENPKIFIGYSDITALLLSFYKRAGLVTFHGPVLREISRDEGDNWTSLEKTISNGRRIELSLSGAQVIRPGKTAGPVLGGNLSLVCNMMGTPFLPSLNKKILFLEEKGEAPYRIDRMLAQLRLSGVLDEVSGVLLGSFEQCGDPSDLREMFSEIFSALEMPVLMGVPSGHGVRNRTIPMGVRAEVDTEKMVLTFMETVTVPRKEAWS